jgi:hypothetical protein
MAMKAVLSSDVSQIDDTAGEFIVDGTITLTGSYATNGDTLDFSQLGLPCTGLPTKVEIYEATPAPGPAYGGIYTYVPGTTQANGLVQLNVSAGTQTAAVAYSGLATGFALRFRAWFPSFI